MKSKRKKRSNICSFRLRDEEIKALNRDLRNHAIAGVKSTKQFCRKLAVDYAQGRLVYGDYYDRLHDPDVRAHIAAINPTPAYDPRIESTALVAALKNFLTSDDHYRRLRLFVLQFGWPEKAKLAFRAARSEKERMEVLHKLLTHFSRTKSK